MRLIRILLLAGWLLVGCSSAPPRRPVPEPESARITVPGMQEPSPSALGSRAAAKARSLVGVPYRYGGQDPQGFDCSGLVWYVFKSLAVDLPRQAGLQRDRLPAVSLANLQPGDLLFFATPADHVGIYLGGGEFVHAPRTGKSVSIAHLDSPFFELGFAGAARVTPP